MERGVGKCVGVWEKVRKDMERGVGGGMGVGVFKHVGRGVGKCVWVWGVEGRGVGVWESVGEVCESVLG